MILLSPAARLRKLLLFKLSIRACMQRRCKLSAVCKEGCD